MQKAWSKTNEGLYTCESHGVAVGSMRIEHATMDRKAQCKFGEKEFEFKRIGFWRSTVEIRSKDGALLGTLQPEKWYANTWILDYKGESFQLAVRNNPLAEYVLSQNGKEVLAYGLDSKDAKLVVRISTTSAELDLLLDCLLWYYFVPIAMENFGDSFSLLMLMNTSS